MGLAATTKVVAMSEAKAVVLAIRGHCATFQCLVFCLTLVAAQKNPPPATPSRRALSTMKATCPHSRPVMPSFK